jgi:hypothetical protein
MKEMRVRMKWTMMYHGDLPVRRLREYIGIFSVVWTVVWVVGNDWSMFCLALYNSTDFWKILFWKTEGLEIELFEPLDADHVTSCDTHTHTHTNTQY